MSSNRPNLVELRQVLRNLAKQGKVVAFSLGGTEERPVVRLRTIGPPLGDLTWLSDQRSKMPGVIFEEEDRQREPFRFLARELRPGSGIVRVVAGTPSGPEGTLTCFLSRNGRDLYFACAAHGVTNFWNTEDGSHLGGSIYLNEKGYPSRESERFLGKLHWVSPRPPLEDESVGPDPTIDLAIVKLSGSFDWKQRTTCYGSFGKTAATPKKDDSVTKCGAEEPHGTDGLVASKEPVEVLIEGPKGTYRFAKQVILEDKEKGSPFAVPGDSGTIIVDKDSKSPLGMLIAGSVLDGRYVMTPIDALIKKWEGRDLDLALL
ncbi:MAG TPA: hypothetical protein VNJ70_04980 [Thermoanaerobaculia bacterium]|nr:hypothetical protein [Thermoanaerobaculia bacterium]